MKSHKSKEIYRQLWDNEDNGITGLGTKGNCEENMQTHTCDLRGSLTYGKLKKKKRKKIKEAEEEKGEK